MSYESEILRDWYLLFHFGSAGEILDGVGFDTSGLPRSCLEFPAATVAMAGDTPAKARALDVGCAVGRSSFELSRTFDEVVGIDFSAGFIAAAEEIRQGRPVAYTRYAEMHLGEPMSAGLPEGARPERVTFEEGDAMDLRGDLGSFDLVHAANLLCRLPEPARFLARLADLVRPGGALVLATPATWLEEYTPAANRPEGPTLDYLHAHLDAAFEFREARELPFLIREHKRKLQLSTSETSLWVRR